MAPIAAGGMGVVYRARRLDTGQPVALKVLLANLAMDQVVRNRFAQGAWLQGQLDHENIVRVDVDFVLEEHVLAFAMELIEGPSLAQLIEQRPGPWPFDDVLRVMLSVIRGVAHAHDRGMIHRDLKPGNVLIATIDGRSVPKVADFDLAKVLQSDSPSAVKTRAGSMLGTPPYMSPEQFRGLVTADKRGDVFALGMMIWQLLAGRLPVAPDDMLAATDLYSGREPMERLDHIANVPLTLADCIQRALALDPAARFADAGELKRALRTALAMPESVASSAVPVSQSVSVAPEAPEALEEEREAGSSVPRTVLQVGLIGVGLALSVGFFVLRDEGSPDVEVVVPSTPEGMSLVEGGDYAVGCASGADGCPDGHAAATVTLEPFFLDRTEVTVAAYARCTAAAGCTEPTYTVHDSASVPHCNGGDASRGDHPINCVTWQQASAYCAWSGRRLPTELEWEAAARGAEGRRYPWGSAEPTCSRVNFNPGSGAEGAGCGAGTTQAVGTHPLGRSGGIDDLAGNVAEWVDATASTGERIAKGGAYALPAAYAASWSRLTQPAAAFSKPQAASAFGLRCALSALD